jgi:peptide-methionine (S)-S-oxide reductase
MIHHETETIVFGGGCFWCTEAVFKKIVGVQSVLPGYSGGHTAQPTYQTVSTGDTGHAECVKVVYDPVKVPLRVLLLVFFNSHNPTKNRQGNDVGTQYRSVVFYTTDQQKKEIQNMIHEINESNKDGAPVVTEVEELDVFYEAEDYHKDYYARNTHNPYCELVINPKLQKIQKEFGDYIAHLS